MLVTIKITIIFTNENSDYNHDILIRNPLPKSWDQNLEQDLSRKFKKDFLKGIGQRSYFFSCLILNYSDLEWSKAILLQEPLCFFCQKNFVSCCALKKYGIFLTHRKPQEVTLEHILS